MARRAGIEVGGQTIGPGERRTVALDTAQLYTHTPVGMPVHVIHGRRDGPVLSLSAAIHGDEINGIEIIRQVLALPQLKRLRGTLLAVPIVNAFGVLAQTRYLPDRRDLNRSFPGSAGGSLAARLAHLFVEEILDRATHVIDLHTGAAHRTNLPQVRANLEEARNVDLAEAFAAPVILHSRLRDGSLRAAAEERGLPALVYEGGEALRFDDASIKLGVRGVVAAMRALGMLPRVGRKREAPPPVQVETTRWVRADCSGILRTTTRLGRRVKQGQRLGLISDPFGDGQTPVTADLDGIVIGRTNLPLVHEGDALFHIARVHHLREAAAALEAFTNSLS